MTEAKTMEQIILELREVFSVDEWRNLPLSVRIREGIDAAKEILKKGFGDSVSFGEERMEGLDVGFDYTLHTRPTVTYTVNIDLKDFE